MTRRRAEQPAPLWRSIDFSQAAAPPGRLHRCQRRAPAIGAVVLLVMVGAVLIAGAADRVHSDAGPLSRPLAWRSAAPMQPAGDDWATTNGAPSQINTVAAQIVTELAGEGENAPLVVQLPATEPTPTPTPLSRDTRASAQERTPSPGPAASAMSLPARVSTGVSKVDVSPLQSEAAGAGLWRRMHKASGARPKGHLPRHGQPGSGNTTFNDPDRIRDFFFGRGG
jgi:hypothetical protein